MATLLIVDDERAVRASYQALFESEGYAVLLAKNGPEALQQLTTHQPDLILLDITMPTQNGFKVCEEIRTQNATIPILFLTAMESDANQLRAFALGADDFIPKAVAEPVLVARVQAALARQARLCPPPPQEPAAPAPDFIHLGRVSINLNSLEVLEKGKVIAHLTQNEVMLLQALYRQRGQLLTREELLAAMYGGPYKLQPSALRGYLSNLRQKLGPAGNLISTNWNRGYRLI